MTVQAPWGPEPAVKVVGATEAAPPQSRTGRKAPWWMWAAGVLIVLPLVLPLVFLFFRVLGNS